MTVATATQTSPLDTVRQYAAARRTAESNPAEREKDNDADDKTTAAAYSAETASKAPVAKGVGLLVDVSA